MLAFIENSIKISKMLERISPKPGPRAHSPKAICEVQKNLRSKYIKSLYQSN
jgi:hypothetical protein